MSSRLRSRKFLKLVAVLVPGLFGAILLFCLSLGTVFNQLDHRLLDFYHRQAVQWGKGPKASPQVVLIAITDNSYQTFRKNYLDRKDLAAVNNTLAQLGVEAAAYDIIFARPSSPASDRDFTESIGRLQPIYLPMGFALSKDPHPFRWEQGSAYERLRADYLRSPREKGHARPIFAVRALMQHHEFADAAFNSGHISAYADPDGVYRHVATILRVDDRYVPALSLAMFLDYAKVPFDKVVIEWGRRIVIPAIKGSTLEKDVIVPIDHRGLAYVPFFQPWGKGSKIVEAHALLEHFRDEGLRGNLREIFEGSFVVIGDVSIGTSDLGHTSIETDVPLVILHTSMLNGLLTNTFYTPWRFWPAMALISLMTMVLGCAALPRASWVLYASGAAILLALLGWTWWEFLHFRLFPVFTVGAATLVIMAGLTVGLETATSRERAFIRSAFARYVPEKVVNELLANPGLLKLGGEERVMTVLFSDLAGFTTISEKMTPADLVRLLNEYLTEMTDLTLSHGGIIDKYEGDAIMAEFGAPLPLSDHADRAVLTALGMQRRLRELRRSWADKGLPELMCRIGINTGPMIVGNMGSNQVFDYTVIGDHVNLASRLEGANKRYNTALMISEFTLGHLSEGRFRTRALDVIKVKGKSRAVKVYEVYGEVSDSIPAEDESYNGTYDEAFRSYLTKDFKRAEEGFRKALALRPQDPASREMIGRMEGLDPGALPGDWDGSISLASK